MNGLDPNTGLKAGTTLTLWNPLVLDQYTVKQGDTLFAITNRYFNRNHYMNVLMEYNRISDPITKLKAGMTLLIPLPSGERRHTVQMNETLYSISSIALYNGIGESSGTIKKGQTLQIPNPYYVTGGGSNADEPAKASKRKLAIVIDLSVNKLYVFSGGTVERSFDIASGKQKGLTPIGSFEIMTKIKNPWYSAKGIPGGDPQNPLGSRWLGLDVPNTRGTKYGIHGTNAPESIGTYASAGCIRMQNKDVVWLFDTIPTGTKVEIHA